MFPFFSSSIWGLGWGCTTCPWIRGFVFVGGKNEGDSGSCEFLLPWCYTLQVKLVHHHFSGCFSFLQDDVTNQLRFDLHYLSNIEFVIRNSCWIRGAISCKLPSDRCSVDETTSLSFLSLFSSSVTLDGVCQRPADTGQPLTCTLRTIINRLRRYKHCL